MDSTNDVTLQVLIQIRDQLQAMNSRIDETNTRLDQLSRRVDQTNRQLVTTETRLATEISALRGTVADPDRPLEQCERDIAELRSQR